jgi:hypothetical protein
LPIDLNTKEMIERVISELLYYCQRNNWAGYDPFDGLNSRIFKRLPLLHNRFCRLVLIQGMKRSPVNLRKIFMIPKGQNPKALALFSSALIQLLDSGLLKNVNMIREVLNRLIDLRSPKKSHYCWGYNFDWQSRVFFLPKFVPNIICTTFSGNAILDAYEKFGEAKYLEIATSAGNFIMNGLNITGRDDEICFSYTPLDHGQVHNANLLGAAFLSRLFKLTDNNAFLKFAHSATRFSLNKQNDDGSWPYGEGSNQNWIDNFHTGYNLIALNKIKHHTGSRDFADRIRKGFNFYIQHFFDNKGIPKYYHNQTYPIDIHSIAQSIITLVEFSDLYEKSKDLAIAIFVWSLEHMKSQRGYFYYQKTKYTTNKIPYMRWSQAWMLYALAALQKASLQSQKVEYPL